MIALLALLIAAAPGLFLHLRGRPLLAQRQDPALPERYFAYRRNVGSAVAIAFALLVVFARGQAAWAVPAMLLGMVAGGFRVRRTLFEETWGIASYLAHVLRFTFATLGFWLTIALAPALIVTAEGWWRVAAAGWFALLLAWSLCYNDVFLRAVNAQDLQRRDLDARLDALETLARVTPPRRFVAGPAGGRWANAFALPSSKRGAVVFGRTLLERLEPDELVAVHAHELAHLEHFDRTRLRLGFAVTFTAMVLACLAVPWLARTAVGWSTIALWAWPCLVLFGLTVYASRHKAHEAESDARAVSLLGGEGDALIRALTRIHALSVLPARWAADFEQSATHPSLAARAQAIRAASGLASVGLTEPLLVRGTLAGQRIVLEADRLHLLEGVPADSAESPEAARAAAGRARTLAYAELSELRVHAAVSGPPKLVVRPRVGGELAKVPIRSEDVVSLQVALDRIGAVATPTAGADNHPLVVSILMIGVAIAAMAAGPAVGPLVAAALALIRPAAPGLTAVAATTVGAASLAGASSETAPFGADAWDMARSGLVALGAAAALLAVWEWRRRRAAARWWWVVHLGLAVGSVLALLAWLSAAMVEPAALRLHQAALARPSAVLLPLGLAAALLCAPQKRLRWTAVLPALLAALPLAVRGQGFVDRFAPDPLRAPAAPFARRQGLATPRRSVILDGWAQILRVSPSGASYAWQGAAQGDDEQNRPTFHLGRFSNDEVSHGGHLIAWDLRFVDDARVLALGEADGGLELQLVDTSSEAVGWRRSLPALSMAQLQIDARGERWRVTGLASGRAWTALEGHVGAQGAEERHIPTPLNGLLTPLVTQTAQAALGVRATSILDGLASRLAGLPFDVYGSELWDLSGDQPRWVLQSAFSVDCAAPPPAESPRFVCVVWDGKVSQVWALEPPAWHGTPLGTVPVRLSRPVVAGGRLAATGLRGGGFVLDLGARTFDRLPDGPDAVALDLSLQADTLGMLTLSRQRSAFRLYQLAR